jgi:hypothetical protein
VPTIIRDLPFFDRPTTVSVLGRQIEVKRDQIILWVSLAPHGIELYDQRLVFPAVLDTGCNHSFVMRQQHLVEWSGVPLGQLRRLGSARVYGQLVPLLAANIWLHPNRPREHNAVSGAAPFLWNSIKVWQSFPRPQDIPIHVCRCLGCERCGGTICILPWMVTGAE